MNQSKWRWTLVLALAGLVAAGCASRTPIPPLGNPDESSRRITLPQGFQIRIFAENIPGTPRLMAFGPDRNLYVSLMNAGQVARLPDANRDGKADSVQIVASGLTVPHGLAWKDGWLYVAQQTKIERFFLESNGTLSQKQLVTDQIPGNGGHASRTLHFGPDGFLYVAGGSATNKGNEADPRSATIMRFKLEANGTASIPSDNPFANDSDTRKRSVWATGLRNSVDFLWTPDGKLWASTHGSDNVIAKPGDPPDNLPYEELINHVEKGKHYGWPYCMSGVLGANLPPNQKPEVPEPTTEASNPQNFNCTTQATPALFTTLAHAAPLGMEWGSGFRNFPTDYRDDVYVALAGSWNTDNPANYRDCKIERVIIENGLPVRSETFATGWREPGQKCNASWGRPVDVIPAPDGTMFVSDGKGGRVYRIVYTGN